MSISQCRRHPQKPKHTVSQPDPQSELQPSTFDPGSTQPNKEFAATDSELITGNPEAVHAQPQDLLDAESILSGVVRDVKQRPRNVEKAPSSTHSDRARPPLSSHGSRATLLEPRSLPEASALPDTPIRDGKNFLERHDALSHNRIKVGGMRRECRDGRHHTLERLEHFVALLQKFQTEPVGPEIVANVDYLKMESFRLKQAFDGLEIKESRLYVQEALLTQEEYRFREAVRATFESNVDPNEPFEALKKPHLDYPGESTREPPSSLREGHMTNDEEFEAGHAGILFKLATLRQLESDMVDRREAKARRIADALTYGEVHYQDQQDLDDFDEDDEVEEDLLRQYYQERSDLEELRDEIAASGTFGGDTDADRAASLPFRPRPPQMQASASDTSSAHADNLRRFLDSRRVQEARVYPWTGSKSDFISSWQFYHLRTNQDQIERCAKHLDNVGEVSTGWQPEQLGEYLFETLFGRAPGVDALSRERGRPEGGRTDVESSLVPNQSVVTAARPQRQVPITPQRMG